MNIFNVIKTYTGGWNLKESRNFSEEEKAAIASNVAVESNYGTSICFTMVSGGKTFIPIDVNSNINVGDSIDLSKAKLLTLSRAGEADIYRVSI